MVLTQLLDAVRECLRMGSFHPTMVLTQRSSAKTIRRTVNKFPSHYGSHSTVRLHIYGLSGLTFPSHYGSHSTDNGVRRVSLSAGFPSHYGSHSTSYPRERLLIILVSIPLWFSLNPKRWPSWPNWKCFHPTMVLTQLLGLKPMVISVLGFPSHYGSHSTGTHSYSAPHSTVSIPLWFSLNEPLLKASL